MLKETHIGMGIKIVEDGNGLMVLDNDNGDDSVLLLNSRVVN